MHPFKPIGMVMQLYLNLLQAHYRKLLTYVQSLTFNFTFFPVCAHLYAVRLCMFYFHIIEHKN